MIIEPTIVRDGKQLVFNVFYDLHIKKYVAGWSDSEWAKCLDGVGRYHFYPGIYAVDENMENAIKIAQEKLKGNYSD